MISTGHNTAALQHSFIFVVIYTSHLLSLLLFFLIHVYLGNFFCLYVCKGPRFALEFLQNIYNCDYIYSLADLL